MSIHTSCARHTVSTREFACLTRTMLSVRSLRMHFLTPSTWPARTSKSPPPPPSAEQNTQPKEHCKPKAPRFTHRALSPTKGKLQKCLNTSVNHMPVPPTTRKVCQLHRWAGLDKCGNASPEGCRASLMHCRACVVNAGLHCWELFHTCDDLHTRIDDILAPK